MKTMDRIESEIMGHALRAGIRPNWEAIGERAGITGQTVRRAFRRGQVVTSTTLQYIAEALEVAPEEVRQLHARAQLEREIAATNGHSNGHAPLQAAPPKAEPEPKAGPRDLWAELTEAALTGATVIVSAHSEQMGQSIARGIVTGMHEGLVAIQTVGDQRPVRLRREYVKDVRFPGKQANGAK